MSLWSVKFWVNAPEYIAAAYITADSVEQTNDRTVKADGVEIAFQEKIESVEFVTDPALDDPIE